MGRAPGASLLLPHRVDSPRSRLKDTLCCDTSSLMHVMLVCAISHHSYPRRRRRRAHRRRAGSHGRVVSRRREPVAPSRGTSRQGSPCGAASRVTGSAAPRRLGRVRSACDARRRAPRAARPAVTLVDTNLLIYATFRDAPEHDRARAWLDASSVERGRGGHALLARRLRVRPSGDERPCIRRARTDRRAGLDDCRCLPRAAVRSPRHRRGRGTRRSRPSWPARPGLRSEDVPDLEIAALAIEHGLVLATRDTGFRRFARLRVLDPLA